jgi:DNA-binding PadR family transcriptional regulator
VSKEKVLLGELDEIVLLALLKLGNDSYGVPIHQTVEDARGRFTSIGSIYAALDRLERNGFVSSRMGEATNERGGKPKKYFKIEGAGMKALQEAEQTRRSIIGRLRWQQARGRA